jgi:hypothetical protein
MLNVTRGGPVERDSEMAFDRCHSRHRFENRRRTRRRTKDREQSVQCCSAAYRDRSDVFRDSSWRQRSASSVCCIIQIDLAYVLSTRAILLVVYWLARIFRWQETRFGGLADSPPFIGFIAIPFATAAFWIVASLVVGGAIGSAILAIMSRRSPIPEKLS